MVKLNSTVGSLVPLAMFYHFNDVHSPVGKNPKPKSTAADDLVEVVLAGVCASDLWSDCMAGAISALKKAVHTTGGLAHSAQCTEHSGERTVLAPY